MHEGKVAWEMCLIKIGMQCSTWFSYNRIIRNPLLLAGPMGPTTFYISISKYIHINRGVLQNAPLENEHFISNDKQSSSCKQPNIKKNHSTSFVYLSLENIGITQWLDISLSYNYPGFDFWLILSGGGHMRSNRAHHCLSTFLSSYSRLKINPTFTPTYPPWINIVPNFPLFLYYYYFYLFEPSINFSRKGIGPTVKLIL